MLDAIICILKNYHPIQKIMSEVVSVYKFGQEFFIIGIFKIILYKYPKKNPAKAAYTASLQHAKI